MGRNNEPVGYTCPDIDHCLRALKDANDYIESAVNGVEDLYFNAETSTEEMKNSVVYDLKSAASCVDLSYYLEQLRTANETLRSWGGGLTDQVDTLEKENEGLHEKIVELLAQVEDLKRELKDAETYN
jgi:predicted  nucleic acid-binding Zn-ribbon protein